MSASSRMMNLSRQEGSVATHLSDGHLRPTMTRLRALAPNDDAAPGTTTWSAGAANAARPRSLPAALCLLTCPCLHAADATGRAPTPPTHHARSGVLTRLLTPLRVCVRACPRPQPYLLVYGGDPTHVPTIGSVVKLLREQLTCHVLAVQAAGGAAHCVEPWLDAVFE